MDGPGLIFFSPRKTNQTNFDEKEKKGAKKQQYQLHSRHLHPLPVIWCVSWKEQIEMEKTRNERSVLYQ
jgi:hypothetical protein